MLNFSDRMKLTIAYRAWLQKENETHLYQIADEPDTFLIYCLFYGLLNEEKIKDFLKKKDFYKSA